MKWAKRVFNAPLLLDLKRQKAVLQERIERYQQVIWTTCDMSPEADVSERVGKLEEALLEMADIEERMSKLWS